MVVALAVLLLLALFLISPVKILVLYHKDCLLVKAGVGALMISVYNSANKKKPNEKKKPVKEPEKPAKTDEKKKKKRLSLKKIKQLFEVIFDTLKFLKRHLTFFDFKVKLNFGTGDAAQTGILTGTAWALFYNIVGLIDRTFKLKKHEVDVKPDFEDEKFELNFRCEAGLRVFWAIAMAFALLKNLNKIRKVM